MLVARNLVKSYGEQKVIDNFSYAFPNQGMIAIIGPSGVGKSTLLYLLAGMEIPDDGEVYFDGENLADYSPSKLNQYHRHHLSLVFQNDYLFPELTVMENLQLALKIRGYHNQESLTLINQYLDEFHLSSLKEQKVVTLSGGEKSRIGLIRALIHQPEMIFADEPTGALDMEAAMQVMESLKQASKRALVIVVTHNEYLAHTYSEKIINLKYSEDYQKDVIVPLKVKRDLAPSRRELSLTSLFFKNGLFRKNMTDLLNTCSLTLGLLSAAITLGFYHGTHQFMDHLPYQYLDMNTALIQEVRKEKMHNSPLVLNKMAPPSLELQAQIKEIFPEISFCFNYDYVINQHLVISYGNIPLTELEIVTVDSWEVTSLKEELIIEGMMPLNDQAMMINVEAKNYLFEQIKEEVIGKSLDYELLFFYENEHPSDTSQKIKDTLMKDFSLEITGVVEEANVLAIPKIFLSYAFIESLTLVPMENWSEVHEETILWKEFLIESEDSALSDYAVRMVFPYQYIEPLLRNLNGYALNKTTTIDLKNAGVIGLGAFQSLYDFLKIAFTAFLVIGATGVLAIIIIITFAKLVMNKKNLAILRSLGASNKQLSDYFLIEIIMQFLVSFLILGLSPFFLPKINQIFKRLTGIKNAIIIPLHLPNIPYGWPLIIFTLGVLILSMVIILTFQYFSRQIIVKELISE